MPDEDSNFGGSLVLVQFKMMVSRATRLIFETLPEETFKTVPTESMATRCLPGFTENVLADWAFKSFV